MKINKPLSVLLAVLAFSAMVVSCQTNSVQSGNQTDSVQPRDVYVGGHQIYGSTNAIVRALQVEQDNPSTTNRFAGITILSNLGGFVAECAGGPRSTFWFTIQATPNPRGLPSTAITNTILDAITITNRAGVRAPDQIVSPNVIRGLETITFTAAPASVATIDQSGYLTHVTDGVATVTLSSTTCVLSTNLTLTTIAITNVVISDGAPGSTRESATGAIDDNLSGGQSNIYSTINHGTATYVRNASCWAAGVDLSCVAVWNSTSGNSQRGATLISPRHILMAKHYPVSVGATVRFVTMAGAVVTRTLMSVNDIAGTDIRIGLLDTAATGCTPAKVLPSSYATKLPTSGRSIPSLGFDQDQLAIVSDILDLAGCSMQAPEYNGRTEFYETKIAGDSGQPSFLIIGGDPVVLCAWLYGGAGAGPAVHLYLTEIDAAMTDLGGGYTTTAVDLSGFNDY